MTDLGLLQMIKVLAVYITLHKPSLVNQDSINSEGMGAGYPEGSEDFFHLGGYGAAQLCVVFCSHVQAVLR